MVDKDGRLLFYFIIIVNGDFSKGDIIVVGNGWVIWVCLVDVKFFY